MSTKIGKIYMALGEYDIDDLKEMVELLKNKKECECGCECEHDKD